MLTMQLTVCNCNCTLISDALLLPYVKFVFIKAQLRDAILSQCSAVLHDDNATLDYTTPGILDIRAMEPTKNLQAYAATTRSDWIPIARSVAQVLGA